MEAFELFFLFKGCAKVIHYILLDVPLWRLCVDFEVMAAKGSDHFPTRATFEWVSSKKLAANSDRKKTRRENKDLGIRKALKVTGEKEKDSQNTHDERRSSAGVREMIGFIR